MQTSTDQSQNQSKHFTYSALHPIMTLLLGASGDVYELQHQNLRSTFEGQAVLWQSVQGCINCKTVRNSLALGL